MYRRTLDLAKALQKKSHFLLGPRATGKSWLIREQLSHVQSFDLLNLDTFTRLLKNPASLGQEIRSQQVVIDEIQKLPVLLDEVHRLIEEKKIHFLLTGSSVRKLKRGSANLLAGRARNLSIFPLTTREIPEFDLLQYCNRGGLPAIYSSNDAWMDLRDYCQMYLREEVIAEALIRHVENYARFLDVAGLSSGQEINYQKLATDSAVPVRTVASFVEILKDTLLAYELEPYRKTRNRKVTTKSKLYLFDVGVANYFAGRKELLPRAQQFGVAFEHFILQEVRAYLGYNAIDLPMTYWKISGQELEVDLVVGDELAVEIKSSENFNEKMLEGLVSLNETRKFKHLICVTRDPIERKIGAIQVLNWQIFFERLWAGEFV